MKASLQPDYTPSTGNDIGDAYVARIYNGIVEKDQFDRPYTTQRPGFEQEINASGTLADCVGRGCVYWNALSTFYYAADDSVSGVTKIYKGAYTAPCTGATLATGTKKVYFAEVGGYLAIIDPEGNKGYYIDSAASTVLVEITDVDFPPKQTPALSLARGAVELKGRLYILDTQGTIWNSALEDPTAWSGGDNINAEIEADDGIAIAKHNEQIVVFGRRTIEYFFHNGNPQNSPLSANQTIYHEIGSADIDSFYEEEKALFFISRSRTSDLAVYRMQNFAVQQISTHGVSAKLTQAYNSGSSAIFAHGVSAHGRTFYMMTIDSYTHVYDSRWGLWYVWETVMLIDSFPLVDWSVQAANEQGQGMLSNGDLISVRSDWLPYDISSLAAIGNISVNVTTGALDFGTRKRKYMNNVRIDGYVSDASTTDFLVQINYLDDGATLGKQLTGTYKLNGYGQIVPRAGAFHYRAFSVTFPYTSSGPYPVGTFKRAIVYGLEFDLVEGLS